jgi:hypothetical protein
MGFEDLNHESTDGPTDCRDLLKDRRALRVGFQRRF